MRLWEEPQLRRQRVGRHKTFNVRRRRDDGLRAEGGRQRTRQTVRTADMTG